MEYGAAYQLYGAGECPNCHSVHGQQYQIQETQSSRFCLMQFMAEMSTIITAATADEAAQPPVIHAGASQKYMIGVLVSGQTTLIAASGGNFNKGDFQRVAAMKQYEICPPRSATEGNHSSASGRQIPVGQYMATQATGASPPGGCAAPRLIQQALSMPHLATNFHNWEMSEVFYQPNTSRRTRDDLHWVHGLSAHHCGTCDNLVPLLMCPET